VVGGDELDRLAREEEDAQLGAEVEERVLLDLEPRGEGMPPAPGAREDEGGEEGDGGERYRPDQQPLVGEVRVVALLARRKALGVVVFVCSGVVVGGVIISAVDAMMRAGADSIAGHMENLNAQQEDNITRNEQIKM